jgi:hypothetical protein
LWRQLQQTHQLKRLLVVRPLYSAAAFGDAIIGTSELVQRVMTVFQGCGKLYWFFLS